MKVNDILIVILFKPPFNLKAEQNNKVRIENNNDDNININTDWLLSYYNFRK